MWQIRRVRTALGKPFAERPPPLPSGALPSVTLGKVFAECKQIFAECNQHSAKKGSLVVVVSHGNLERNRRKRNKKKVLY